MKTSAIERVELKYFLPPGLEPLILADLKVMMGPMKQYRVRSLYFDTQLLKCYRDKQDGIDPRMKVRARCYPDPSGIRQVFFEIKHRRGRFTFKERASLPSAEAKVFIESGVVSEKNETLSRFRFLRSSLGLNRLQIIEYIRTEMEVPGAQYERITLDHDIRTSISDRLLDSELAFHPLRLQTVLELKFLKNMPWRFRFLVEKYSLNALPISKYAYACQVLM